jgi:hypothetical protein
LSVVGSTVKAGDKAKRCIVACALLAASAALPAAAATRYLTVINDTVRPASVILAHLGSSMKPTNKTAELPAGGRFVFDIPGFDPDDILTVKLLPAACGSTWRVRDVHPSAREVVVEKSCVIMIR